MLLYEVLKETYILPNTLDLLSSFWVNINIKNESILTSIESDFLLISFSELFDINRSTEISLIFNYTTCKDKLILVTILLLSFFLVKPTLLTSKVVSYEYFCIMLLASLSLLIIIDTNDLIFFYLLIEAQSICFYILASINRVNIFSVEAGLKYFILGAFMSCFYLLGSILMYCILGSFNLDEIQFLIEDKLRYEDSFNLIFLFGIFLVTSFLLFKMTSAPFHFWMPDVYEGSILSSTIIFSLLPKYSLIYFLIKWFSSVGLIFFESFQILLVLFGCLSITLGTLYGIKQTRFKRMLLYSSITQIGFLVVNFGMDFGNSINSSYLFFYIITYVLNSLSAWGFLQIVYTSQFYRNEVERFNLVGSLTNAELLNIIPNSPLWLFFLGYILFSVAGIPPYVLFISKVLVFDNLVFNGYLFLVILIIIINSISVYYYIRVLKISFFEPILQVSKKKQAIITDVKNIYIYSFIFLTLFFNIFLFFYPNILLVIL